MAGSTPGADRGLCRLIRRAQPQDMLLNGQYILLRRDMYKASGGFASVHGEALKTWPFALACAISDTMCR